MKTQSVPSPNAPQVGTYTDNRGVQHPTLTLNPSSRWPFSLGIAKCRLILEPANLAAIRAFVADADARSQNELPPLPSAPKSAVYPGL